MADNSLAPSDVPAQLAQRYDMKPDKLIKKLDERNAIDQILEEILTGKVLDFLVANASVSTIPAASPAPVESEAPAQS